MREYIWVGDAVQAISRLDERLADMLSGRDNDEVHGQAYNISSGQGRSVRDCAESVAQHYKGLVPAPIWVCPPDIADKVEIPYQALSTKKIRAATGWSPATDFDTAVQALLHWWVMNWSVLSETLKNTKVEGWH